MIPVIPTSGRDRLTAVIHFDPIPTRQPIKVRWRWTRTVDDPSDPLRGYFSRPGGDPEIGPEIGPEQPILMVTHDGYTCSCPVEALDDAIHYWGSERA